jgi:Mono-functional DNA-alkylating methyl methanesulfonate N-term
VCREDGVVLFIEIDGTDAMLLKTAMRGGTLGCDVDTAFACLDTGLDGPDLLIAGGDMCSGGLYIVSHHQERKELRFNLCWQITSHEDPVLIESLPNCSPIVDFALANNTTTATSGSAAVHRVQRRDRVFACSGRGENGAVSELRHGIQAHNWLNFELHTDVERFWTFPDPQKLDVYFLLSLVDGTSTLLRLEAQNNAVEALDEHETSLDLESATLTAAAINDTVIQVTESYVRIGNIRIDGTKPAYEYKEEGKKITNAVIHTNSSAIVLATHSDDQYTLQVFGVLRDQIVPVGEKIALPSSPTCLHLGYMYVS